MSLRNGLMAKGNGELEGACRKIPRPRVARGEMNESPKGQHAWGKGSEGQAVVHRARRGWQAALGLEPSIQLRSPAGCSAPGCLQELSLGVLERLKVGASDWPPLPQCCDPPPAPWGHWVGGLGLARHGCVGVCSGGHSW